MLFLLVGTAFLTEFSHNIFDFFYGFCKFFLIVQQNVHVNFSFLFFVTAFTKVIKFTIGLWFSYQVNSPIMTRKTASCNK